jgi:hypothetical protein
VGGWAREAREKIYKNTYKGGWVGEWSPQENMKSIYRGWVKKNIEDIENHFKGH